MPEIRTHSDIDDWYSRPTNGQASSAPEPKPKSAWPDPPDEAAYHGVAGKLTRLIEPHSEADPAALLLQALIGWGSLAGRGPYYLAEADRHHTNEYAVLVGAALGDPTADEILRALKASPNGMTRWEVHNHFARHKPSQEIERAINVLLERGLVRSQKEDTGGRPGTRYWAIT